MCYKGYNSGTLGWKRCVGWVLAGAGWNFPALSAAPSCKHHLEAHQFLFRFLQSLLLTTRPTSHFSEITGRGWKHQSSNPLVFLVIGPTLRLPRCPTIRRLLRKGSRMTRRSVIGITKTLLWLMNSQGLQELCVRNQGPRPNTFYVLPHLPR